MDSAICDVSYGYVMIWLYDIFCGWKHHHIFVQVTAMNHFSNYPVLIQAFVIYDIDDQVV